MTITVPKLCYMIATVLFVLSIWVSGPLVAAGLAFFAAGHALS